MAQLTRVRQFSVSSDGFGTGEGQSRERPFGHLEPSDLHQWVMETSSWSHSDPPGGTMGLDDLIARSFPLGIGAEIMGRNKFASAGGPWPDDAWTGWWGDEPPFHTPVFVLTHHTREPLTLGETTFYFINETPESALKTAQAAANGRDVRIGGGVATVRSFLDADLIDTLHIAVVPICAERGERLWNGPEDLEDRYQHETITGSNGIVHHFFWRK